MKRAPAEGRAGTGPGIEESEANPRPGDPAVASALRWGPRASCPEGMYPA